MNVGLLGIVDTCRYLPRHRFPVLESLYHSSLDQKDPSPLSRCAIVLSLVLSRRHCVFTGVIERSFTMSSPCVITRFRPTPDLFLHRDT
jgi:hypothetical protein